jgi:hypothetical protein
MTAGVERETASNVGAVFPLALRDDPEFGSTLSFVVLLALSVPIPGPSGWPGVCSSIAESTCSGAASWAAEDCRDTASDEVSEVTGEYRPRASQNADKAATSAIIRKILDRIKIPQRLYDLRNYHNLK